MNQLPRATRPVSNSIELRAPVNPRDPGGDYYLLEPGATTPRKGPAHSGGYYRAAPDGAVVLWLGKAPHGSSPGNGVLAEKALAGFRTEYWLKELRAWPSGRWDASEALLTAQPAAERMLSWINHWLPSAQISDDGSLLLGEDLPETIYPRPPAGVDTGGQTSYWLANADGHERVAQPMRLYIRRDEFIQFLTRCPWPAPGRWRSVRRAEVLQVLKKKQLDWPGVIEARPPEIGLLRSVDGRQRPRRLWSVAEVLAWAHPDWQIGRGWVPAQTIPSPMRLPLAPCAPLRNLVGMHLFLELFRSRQARSSLTMVWLSSRARAQVAPAARVIYQWCGVNGGIGHITGQHAGAIYLVVPDYVTADLAAHVRLKQPLMLFPGNTWREVEENDPATERKAQLARSAISRQLQVGKLPKAAWPDLLSFGTTEHILAADAQANRMKPAYDAPAAAAPPRPASSKSTLGSGWAVIKKKPSAPVAKAPPPTRPLNV